MKIRDIQIDGFGVWSGLSVDSLPTNMTVFYGPNEAGKTTLMQFLRAMFYGFTPERRTRYLPPVYGGKPGGIIRVTGPGGGYEIARRAQLDAETVTGQLTVTSSDGVSQGQHRLSTLLGNIDERIFTNVFAIGLRELQELNTLDDTAAADELYKLSSGLDRVSLVDVIRKLKSARSQVVGADADSGQMQAIMLRREKLKDELDQLNNRSRRWGELASVRRSQQKEIQELRTRIETLSLEAKTIELSMQVREPWQKRSTLRESISALNARLDLPDDAESRLQKLQEEIDEKRLLLEELKQQRDAIRAAADALPLNKGVMALATKIDVANEQGPWISALQKQIVQLRSQIEKSRELLLEDAKRLGLNEEDRDALLNDKRMANMPELSRQAISQLAGPAKDVRTHLASLRQAKTQIRADKKEAEKLGEKLRIALEARNLPDLTTALSQQQALLGNLRKLEQVEERIDKLAKHKKELEGESVDLASNETLNFDGVRAMLLPFAGGATLLTVALLNILGIAFESFSSTTIMMMAFVGAILLMVCYMWTQMEQRTTSSDLVETEGQLEGLMIQMRKVQTERDDMLQTLPEHAGSVDQRIREAEGEMERLEALLPIGHNFEAVQQRLRSATRDAKAASDGFRSSRNHWKRTLSNLGLAESLSPKSIRIMAEGYESLVQGRRRLKTLEDELEQRTIELTAIDAKIDSLLRQILAMDGMRSKAMATKPKLGSEPIESTRIEPRGPVPKTVKPTEQKPRSPQMSMSAEDNGYDTSDSPVEKLAQLQSIIAGQQQHITRRRELRSEFEELVRRHKAIRKSIDKLKRSQDAQLAEMSVEDVTQLGKLMDKKREHERLTEKIEDADSRIHSVLGGNVPYETVARLLDNAAAAKELEKRFEAINQHIAQSQQRVSQLLEKQGETQQEMKSIAGDRRLLEIKTELLVLDRQVELMAEHWRTLATTDAMLQRVCEVYETERQPETLREASVFLKQLTDGKYVRVWTPLGKNALRVENEKGQDLPIEVLSRGTREAVFIALRLSLAAAYSRRGVMLPLVLDDVLVNFDAERAYHAAKVLRDFSQLGHQTIFFTCHEHIMRMFDSIGVQVRVLPEQGQSGEARVYAPPIETVPVVETHIEEEPVVEYVEEVIEEPVAPATVLPEVVTETIQTVVEEPRHEVIVETVQEEPPRRRVRSQPKPFKKRRVVVESVIEPPPVEYVDRMWYESELDAPENAMYDSASDIRSIEEINANWLSSDSLPGVAWDWDTLEISKPDSVNDASLANDNHRPLEPVRADNTAPWWRP